MIDIKERIIWESADFIVVNKPAGIASQSSKTHVSSVWTQLEEHRSEKLHLSNRLDQPVSGCLLFSKHREDNTLEQPVLHKVYIAIVEKKKDIPEQGTLINYLKRDGKKSKSICSDKKAEGFKKSVLHYTTLKELDNYLILKVILRTGRFHQIRSQLSHFGFPIKGDVKYGARRKNKDRSIYLHAYELKLHPGQDNEKVILAEFPIDDTLWNEAKVCIN